jgi:hypothetical protein
MSPGAKGAVGAGAGTEPAQWHQHRETRAIRTDLAAIVDNYGNLTGRTGTCLESEIAVLGGDAAAAAWSLHMPVHAQKLLVDRAAPRRLFQAAEL